jgi:hypothetical protein
MRFKLIEFVAELFAIESVDIARKAGKVPKASRLPSIKQSPPFSSLDL